MSSHITITLPDATTREFQAGVTGAEIAASIGAGLAKAALGIVVDGVARDLSTPIDEDATVAIVTGTSEQGREMLRHSTSHLLAQAVVDLFPGTKYAIGPAITDGFYYDFELPGGAHFSDGDLERIEARMRAFVAEDQRFERAEYDVASGTALFAHQPYKVDIIERAAAGDVSSEEAHDAAGGASAVSVYRNVVADGSVAYIDLCRGPHVPSTGKLGAFKLTKVAGAYWRGDEKRPMLQRIYGTAWESKAALAEHLQRVEEAERRDHRKLGTELDLFSFPEELGGGLAVWHPKGAAIRRVMEDYSRAVHDEAGYELVFTPHLAKAGLWETSGHLDFYADGMYPPMELDNGSYYPKPMNCPFHIMIFKSHQRSYRVLPLRFFELGTVYRYERSGTLHGLFRIRGFTQDDSHIFCTREQAADELASLLAFVLRVLRTFGFEDFEAQLATRPPEKSVGADADWDLATEALRSAIVASGLKFAVDEGGGAFYGPKIDVKVRDAIGRVWQLSTIQVDFQLPARFDLEYVGADNDRHQPIMIHRALFGSVERFFGILLEHFAGAFPFWLAPVQVTVLSVADRHDEYARSVVATLKGAGHRVEFSSAANDTLGARVRRAKLEKIPFVLVVGDDDARDTTVGVNERGSERPERAVPVADFVARLAVLRDSTDATLHGVR